VELLRHESAARRLCCAASNRTSQARQPRSRWPYAVLGRKFVESPESGHAPTLPSRRSDRDREGIFCCSSNSQTNWFCYHLFSQKEVPMSMIHHCCGRMGRASVALGLAVASAVALACGPSA